MAEILNLQDAEPDPTPGEEKASNISTFNWFCKNSFVSWSICYVK